MSKLQETNKTIFGFWVYLMTDIVLFATLFATFLVLRDSTAGGPTGGELFSMPFVLVETLLLLTSSFTAGLAMLAAHNKDQAKTLGWFGVTFILGIMFLTLELSEFSNLTHEGYGWQASAFMSAFFTLVGTHGLHITFGLIWMATLMLKLYRSGFKANSLKRLTMLSLFWHFLDIVWIFIFTIVYLLGEVNLQ
ncbi:MAG TPA: cytochrome o ubiquinol oxidase subunit III [Candidatus Saccharimonadales bacterium]|nr:cytochrome o ubiquinol oxidase subunit III [Candidatus Saccharimonadales bacterium]